MMNNYDQINMFLVERAIEVLEASDDKIDNKEIDKKVTDITSKLDELKKEYRSLSHAVNRKEADEARKIYKKAEKLIDDIEDMIDDLPDITKDDDKSKTAAKKIAKSVLGVSTAITFSGVIVSGLGTKDKTINAGYATTLAGIAGMVGSIYAIALNRTFKNKMVSALYDYQRRMDWAIGRIHDIENEDKEDRIRMNTKNVNINRNNTNTNDTTIRYESTDIVNTKLAIHEAYDNGYITESEKNDLLIMIND